MTTDAPPWEPPFAGSEAGQVVGSLDRLRVTFRWKADGLDAAGLNARLGPSTLTLGGLMKHLAVQEDYASTVKLTGEDMGEAWSDNGWDSDDDWEFTSAADDDPETLYALYDAAVGRARRRFADAVAAGGMDAPVHAAWPDGTHANLRRLLCDLLEEYGRHTGQADLLREAGDGRTGEDQASDGRPPPRFLGDLTSA